MSGWQRMDRISKEGRQLAEDSEPHLTATWSVASQGQAPCAYMVMQELRDLTLQETSSPHRCHCSRTKQDT